MDKSLIVKGERQGKGSGPFERGIRIAECGIEEQGQKIEKVQGSEVQGYFYLSIKIIKSKRYQPNRWRD